MKLGNIPKDGRGHGQAFQNILANLMHIQSYEQVWYQASAKGMVANIVGWL